MGNLINLLSKLSKWSILFVTLNSRFCGVNWVSFTQCCFCTLHIAAVEFFWNIGTYLHCCMQKKNIILSKVNEKVNPLIQSRRNISFWYVNVFLFLVYVSPSLPVSSMLSKKPQSWQNLVAKTIFVVLTDERSRLQNIEVIRFSYYYLMQLHVIHIRVLTKISLYRPSAENATRSTIILSFLLARFAFSPAGRR